jgi:hypothetical protein
MDGLLRVAVEGQGRRRLGIDDHILARLELLRLILLRVGRTGKQGCRKKNG